MRSGFHRDELSQKSERTIAMSLIEMSIPAGFEFHSDTSLTDLLRLAAKKSPGAKDELYRRIYEDLLKCARKVLRQWPRSDMDAADLIHSVVLRFEHSGALARFPNRRVLFAVSMRAMNQIVVDHHRRRLKLIDSPERRRRTLVEMVQRIESHVGYDSEALQHGLEQLKRESPRQHDVLVYKVFGGYTIWKIANLLGVSRQTVDRDWKLAKAKLFRFMKDV